MTDEELIARLRDDSGDWLTDAAADRLEALVNKAVLDKAAYEGVSSLLLSVQQDCIKERQRAERLEARCKALIAAYDKAHWMRTADYHGDECDCLRCHFDYLRAALKGADHE